MTTANFANPLKIKSRTAKVKPKEESFFKKIANYAHSIFDSEDAEPSVIKDTAEGNENAQSPLNPKPSIAELIKLQQANGSIGNDLSESVLTLLVFILEGNTRKSGLRKRNVLKLVMWLALQPDTELKKHAMDTLEAAERGDRIEKNMAWNSIAPHSLAHRFLS